MRRSASSLALAFSAAFVLAMPVGAASAGGVEGLHVEFQRGMPVFVQTLTHGDRDIDETSFPSYAQKVMLGETVKAPVGYAVKPAPIGCDAPDRPCPSRRAALPDDRAGDLPAGFNIEIADEPDAEDVRLPLRAVKTFSDGPSSWLTPASGQSPYEPYGGGTVHVMTTDSGKLRQGALAQADCFEGTRLCAVRITYARDLRVNFLSSETGEALARQVRAVDAFMRSVIRPGPLPSPREQRATRQAGQPPSDAVYFSGLPLNSIRAAGGFPR